jgi:hypothetical protein
LGSEAKRLPWMLTTFRCGRSLSRAGSLQQGSGACTEMVPISHGTGTGASRCRLQRLQVGQLRRVAGWRAWARGVAGLQDCMVAELQGGRGASRRRSSFEAARSSRSCRNRPMLSGRDSSRFSLTSSTRKAWLGLGLGSGLGLELGVGVRVSVRAQAGSKAKPACLGGASEKLQADCHSGGPNVPSPALEPCRPPCVSV